MQGLSPSQGSINGDGSQSPSISFQGRGYSSDNDADSEFSISEEKLLPDESTPLNDHQADSSTQASLLSSLFHPQNLRYFLFHTNLFRQGMLNLGCLIGGGTSQAFEKSSANGYGAIDPLSQRNAKPLPLYEPLQPTPIDSQDNSELHKEAARFSVCHPLYQDIPIHSGYGYAKWADGFFKGDEIFRYGAFPRWLGLATLYDLTVYLLYPSERYGNTPWNILSGFAPGEMAITSALSRYPNVYYPLSLISIWTLTRVYRSILAMNPNDAVKLSFSTTENLFGTWYPAKIFRRIHEMSRAIRLDGSSSEEQKNEWLDALLSLSLSSETYWSGQIAIINALTQIAASIAPGNEQDLSADALERHIARKEKIFQHLETLSRYTTNSGAFGQTFSQAAWSTIVYAPTRMAATYALLSLGKRGLLSSKRAWPALLFKAWAEYRLWLTLIIAAQTYFANQAFEHHCRDANKEPAYSFHTGMMHCAVCHNVPFEQQNDAQSCIDAFLASPKSLEEIETFFTRLQHFSFKSLPLGSQNWSAWNTSDWQALESLFNGTRTQTIRFTDTTGQNHTLLSPEGFGDFVRSQNATQLDFTNVRGIPRLLDYLDGITPTALNISQSDLAGGLENFAGQTFSSFNMSGADRSDVEALSNFFTSATVTGSLDLGGEVFSANLTEPLSHFLQQANNVRLPAVENTQQAETLSASLSHAKRIDASRQDLSKSNAEALFNASHPDASSINLSDNPLSDPSVIVEPENFSHLKSVQLDGTLLSQTGFRNMLRALNGTGTESLSVSNTGLSRESFSDLGDIQFPAIQTLDFSNNPIGEMDDTVLAFLTQQTSLQTLNLNQARLSESDIITLFETYAFLPFAPVNWGISGAGISENALSALSVFLTRHPEIQSLDLSDTDINDAQLASLLPDLKNTQIKQLYLARTQITDTGATALLNNLLPQLTHLDLSGNAFPSDFGVRIAESFLDPFAHSESFGAENLSGDLQRAIHNTPSRAERLTYLGLEACNLETESARALYRVTHRSALTLENVALSENPLIDFSGLDTTTGQVESQHHQWSSRTPFGLPEHQGLFATSQPSTFFQPALPPSADVAFSKALPALGILGTVGSLFEEQGFPILASLLLLATLILCLRKRASRETDRRPSTQMPNGWLP